MKKKRETPKGSRTQRQTEQEEHKTLFLAASPSIPVSHSHYHPIVRGRLLHPAWWNTTWQLQHCRTCQHSSTEPGRCFLALSLPLPMQLYCLKMEFHGDLWNVALPIFILWLNQHQITAALCQFLYSAPATLLCYQWLRLIQIQFNVVQLEENIYLKHFFLTRCMAAFKFSSL